MLRHSWRLQCHQLTSIATSVLYAIGDADCFGGWQKLMSDVGCE